MNARKRSEEFQKRRRRRAVEIMRNNLERRKNEVMGMLAKQIMEKREGQE